MLTVQQTILLREAVAEEFFLIIAARRQLMARCLQEEPVATMQVVEASDTAREVAVAALNMVLMQAEPERPDSCTSSGVNVRTV